MSILEASNTSPPEIPTHLTGADVHKEDLEHNHNKYKDRIMSLPKEKVWFSENLYFYQGFWYESKLAMSLESVMAAQDAFKAQPTDIYVATPPKCGTTWLKALAFTIVNRTTYKVNNSSIHPLHTYSPHELVPHIELEPLKLNPSYVDGHSPRLFGTHIPYNSLPRSVLDTPSRLVYMCRNPKDVLVSTFHFVSKLRHESLAILTFEEAFERFCKGVSPYGPYWDHVKAYYKASVENPTKVLFLTYEDMKTDTLNNVKRLAEFLGRPFTAEEEGDGVVQKIIELCSFENLKEANKNGILGTVGPPRNVFFREGKVGDWSNHLTEEMSQILDQITNKEFHGLNISI